MPSFLESGGYVQTAISAPSVRSRKRNLPREIQAIERLKRKRELTEQEEAILRLAKDVFDPPREWFGDQDIQAAQVATAVRETARAAFAPRSTVTYLADDEQTNSSSWAALADLEQSISVPVPARLQLSLSLDVYCDVASAQYFESRVVVTSSLGSASYAHGALLATSGGLRLPVTTIDLLDLLPKYEYVVAPQIRISAAGLSTFTALGPAGTYSDARSLLICRVEARSLATLG